MPEMVGSGPAQLDPCLVRDYFTNKWYTTVKSFLLAPELASRNWSAVSDACLMQQQANHARISVFPDGGYASMRVHASFGGTNLQEAKTVGRTSKYDNLNVTFLALQARPNSFPHR